PLGKVLAFPLLFPIVLIQLIWFLKRNRIHIVNLHYPIDNFVYFAICRLLLPIRLVSSVHGRDAFYKEKPRETYSRAFKLLMHCSDLIILPSNAYRKKFLEAFPAVGNKTIFIHNGVDARQFRPADFAPNRSRSDRYILCIASLDEYKGIDVLLHAARPLLLRDKPPRLV